ncbi:MAG: hypothetical protein K2K89_10925 [Ruminococcus sp.]|nr:hypothetical protein [Ruminococcus sp.]
MKYKEIIINSKLELPYRLIDIDESGEHFIFQFNEFDDKQTDYSIRTGGVTGNFGIIYSGKGMECSFDCDITIGNVRDFAVSLENAYDHLDTRKAVLENYGSLNRSCLSVTFDNKGHCSITGNFLNKDNFYKTGIIFSFSLDQTYIADIIVKMDIFFKELYRIQGHNIYY